MDAFLLGGSRSQGKNVHMHGKALSIPTYKPDKLKVYLFLVFSGILIFLFLAMRVSNVQLLVMNVKDVIEN